MVSASSSVIPSPVCETSALKLPVVLIVYLSGFAIDCIIVTESARSTPLSQFASPLRLILVFLERILRSLLKR